MSKLKQAQLKSIFICILLVFNAQFIKIFAQDEIREDIYIHTDKSIYTPGEIVWFKAYVLDSKNHIPAIKSHILYVKIINNEGECVFSTKLPISNGFTNGEYHVPDAIKMEGTYQIVAYTEKTQNLSPSIWFRSKLIIKSTPTDLVKIKYTPDLTKLSESTIAGTVYCFYDSDFLIKDLKVFCTIESLGKSLYSKTQKTDSLGLIDFHWDIPKNLNNTDLTLIFKTNYLNDTSELKTTIPLGKDKIHLSLFPEGGSLVQGLLNKVAIKVSDNLGYPLNTKGWLINENRNQLQEIKTNDEGLGIFSFIPQANESYYIKLNNPILSDSLYPLTKALESGYLLSVEETNRSNISLKISMTSDLKGERVNLYLSNGINFTTVFDSVLTEENIFSFETSSYPVGIARLTLISENKGPMAERLVFLNKYKKLQIVIETDKESYDPREKVEMLVSTFDFKGNPVSANLSLSVTEEDRMSNDQANIASYLLLDSKLKGNVRNSAFYMHDTPQADSALNMLLMTQGWRKIELIEEYAKIILSPENAAGIRGHVYYKKNKPAQNATVQIINTHTWQIISTTTNDEGAFLIPIDDYLGLADENDLSISVTAPNKKDAKLILEIDAESNSRNFTTFKLKEENIPVFALSENTNFLPEEISKNYYTKFDSSTEFIDEVIIEEKKENIIFDQETKKEIFLKIDKKESSEINTIGFLSSNENGFNGGIVQLLRTVAPGLQLSPQGIIKYRGNNSLIPQLESGVLFVVDGVAKGYNVDAVSWINIGDIKEIQVTKNPGAALKYRNGMSGLVEITMKDGSDDVQNVTEPIKDNNLSVIKGFKVSREFYSPDYTGNTPNQKNYIDLRSTLYWNPNLVLNKKGQARISFYNSDRRTKFRSHIVGFSDSGLLGNNQINYQVK